MTNPLSGFYKKHLQTPEPWLANDYRSQRSQLRRFKVATETLGIRSGDHVADYGCGTAEYARWLHSHAYDVNYSGVEVVPDMLARAKVTTAHLPDAVLLEADVLNRDGEAPLVRAHWAVALGVLGVLAGTKEERYEKATRLLDELEQSASRGFALTVQTTRDWRPRDGGDLRWFVDPTEFLGVILTRYDGWRVVVRADYHPFDMMIAVLRGPF